jgi:uncharacterized membrane protein YfcA
LAVDEASVIALIGLVAGMAGGLAGIGGSILILPALHIAFGPMLFGEPYERPEVHHMYMAAAMTVNVAVSLPAALQHHRVGAVRVSLLPVLLPVSSVAMVLGVLASNQVPGEWLRLALAVFLIAYCTWNLRMIMRPRRRKFTGQGRVERATRPRLALCGGVTGLVGGVLGLGGGFLMVPMLQLVCNMRLKHAIATSSAVLCVTAAIGAALKIATLPAHAESISSAAAYALLMAPPGVIGALAGARWLHAIPVTGVRTIMSVLILAAATRLLG